MVVFKVPVNLVVVAGLLRHHEDWRLGNLRAMMPYDAPWSQ